MNIYGAQVQPGAAPTGMFQTESGFVGISPFEVIPNYLYITQATGSTTSIVTSCLDVEVVV